MLKLRDGLQVPEVRGFLAGTLELVKRALASETVQGFAERGVVSCELVGALPLGP